jgi:hypothetical protein
MTFDPWLLKAHIWIGYTILLHGCGIQKGEHHFWPCRGKAEDLGHGLRAQENLMGNWWTWIANVWSLQMSWIRDISSYKIRNLWLLVRKDKCQKVWLDFRCEFQPSLHDFQRFPLASVSYLQLFHRIPPVFPTLTSLTPLGPQKLRPLATAATSA